MKSHRNLEHARNVALAQTALLCLLAEGVALLVFRQFSDGLLEAALRSAFWIGPFSVWAARPLYRRLWRANRRAR